MLLGGPLGPWQALLMSPKGRNASRDGFANLNISLNSIASFGGLVPSGLALLFCFLLIRRSVDGQSRAYPILVYPTLHCSE